MFLTTRHSSSYQVGSKGMLVLWTHSSIFLYPRSPKAEGGILFYLCPSFRPSKIFFVAYFSVTVDGRNLIFGHKRHIGIPYCGQRFWIRQIPASCLPTQLVFIHIEHICTFFITFFSATIDGKNLIFGHKLHIGTPYCGKRFWTHQIPTSCLPKSRGIISEPQLTVHLVLNAKNERSHLLELKN